MTAAITVSDVHKKFKVYHDKGQTFKERLLFRNRNYYENRWVLKGVGFEVQPGEAIGIIGENGCGKSTLLKLMTRIMYPDQGNIRIWGRVSSLIELGAGFHPDMSGRENIYTNASIFGLSRREIDKRAQDIIAFSELEPYIDNPVRTYSSGMYMRLAFAVAINVDADVLLIDEILAVGDAGFQAKCFNKLRSIKAEGTTIVIVSHSLGQIEQMCEKSIWVHDGVIQAEGSPRDVHPRYLDFMGRKQSSPAKESAPNANIGTDAENASESADDAATGTTSPSDRPPSTGEVKITKVALLNKENAESSVFKTGEAVSLLIQYETKQRIKDPVFGMALYRNDQFYCWGSNTHIDQVDIPEIQGEGAVMLKIGHNPLLPGEYMMDVAVHRVNDFDYDFIKNAVAFRVYSDRGDVGLLWAPHQWVQVS
jgi:ABC-2 type transport system ATP-binding protein